MPTFQTQDVSARLAEPELFRQQCFVGGEWVGEGSTPVENPHDGSVLGYVPEFGAAEARRAIEAANAALPAWRAQTAKERGAALSRWARLCLEHQEDLAVLLTLEQGKAL